MTNELEQGVFAVIEDRTVRGLLLPWDEVSRLSASKTEPISFASGTVRLPRDPNAVTLNVEHSQHHPIGRATALEATDQGIVAEFTILNTDEGDAYLAAPEKRRLSAELRDIARQGVTGLAAVLTGAALVTQGAFESAALFALGDVEDVTDTPAEDAAVLRVEAPEIPDSVVVSTPDSTVTFTPEDDDTEAAEAAEEANMATAIAPTTAADTAVVTEAPTADGLFAAIETARRTGDPRALEGTERAAANFALADQTFDKNATDPGRNYEQALGEIWAGDDVDRQIVPLFSAGTLTELRFTQTQWGTTPLVDKWDGNKTAIPSRSATRTATSKQAQRFAGGLDIAREYADFGHAEDIAEIVRQMVQSYKENSDAYVLDEVLGALTPVAANTYPAGVTTAHGVLVQGARSVRTLGRARASFAVLSEDLYEELLFTPKDNVLEYLGGAIGIQSGTFDGFTVVSHADMAEGTALIGAAPAVRVLELPGSPIRVSAQDIARGGLDEAVFGYVGVSIQRPSALALIDTTAGA